MSRELIISLLGKAERAPHRSLLRLAGTGTVPCSGSCDPTCM